MNTSMREAFRAGSGVDPLLFKTTLGVIVSGVILVIFAWIVLQLMDAHSKERISASEAIWGSTKAFVLLSLVFYVLI